MGFSISWLAVRGKTKDEVLQHFGLVDSGQLDEANESPISGAQLPDGWYIMFFNDLVHSFVDPRSLEAVSVGCRAVACQVEEHVMASSAYSFERGVEVWSVTHESELGPRHLVERGHLPMAYSTIKPELTEAQDKGDIGNEGVDYIWDIPVSLAFEVVGYRHDRVALKDGGEPVFTSLIHAGDA